MIKKRENDYLVNVELFKINLNLFLCVFFAVFLILALSVSFWSSLRLPDEWRCEWMNKSRRNCVEFSWQMQKENGNGKPEKLRGKKVDRRKFIRKYGDEKKERKNKKLKRYTYLSVHIHKLSSYSCKNYNGATPTTVKVHGKILLCVNAVLKDGRRWSFQHK